MDIGVLLVEDGRASAAILRRNLQRCGIERITEVGSLGAALEILREVNPDVALVDLELPDSSGKSTIESMRAAAPNLPILAQTARTGENLTSDILASGADAFYGKEEPADMLQYLLGAAILARAPSSRAAQIIRANTSRLPDDVAAVKYDT